MPHVFIEYSEELFTAESAAMLIDKVFGAVSASGLFEAENIKVRLFPVKYYRVGTENKRYIHIQCRIHRGRSMRQKKRLSEQLVSSLNVFNLVDVIVTAEIHDMDTESYSKQVY